jgi:hypothetical protein
MCRIAGFDSRGGTITRSMRVRPATAVRRWERRASTRELLVAGLLALLAAACGNEQAGSPPRDATGGAERAATAAPGAATEASANLFGNPGFEGGRDGWTHLAGWYFGAFEVVDSPVRSGRRAAHLPVVWPSGKPGRQPGRVYGVVQEPDPEHFPDTLSGWYRVETWDTAAAATQLYCQVVVIVWGDPRTPELVSPDDPDPKLQNYQIRYYLTGVTQPPFIVANARHLFVARQASPPLGQWVRFEIPVKRDFQEHWGVVPESYDFIRVMFEARWDGKPDGSGVSADVYFDDLFFGPSRG